ncbi:MAG: glutamate--tRNA ligase [Thermofilaceae archaeon]
MEEYRKQLLVYALENAIKHGGKAMVNSVFSKLLGSRPDLRPIARELLKLAEEVVSEVNLMSLNEQRELLARLSETHVLVEEKVSSERRHLPPLPSAEERKVVTRFAPNPDFVLHLGSARPAILNYEYSRVYSGRFILRFEDTDPKTKAPMPEAYDIIRDDLKWLGIKWDEEYIQSLRMEIYYDHAKQLLKKGCAYVCKCPREAVSKYRTAGIRCSCAAQPEEYQLELWEKMLNGDFEEGEVTLRIKTDASHPNPSVRDWVALRIINTEQHPHPLTGNKYRVWPTYNFACAIDDRLMGVTHILRGAEHEVNTLKQKYLYEHFGWKYPVAVHFGRLSIEGAILSKSRMREGLRSGLFDSLDDPRLATLRALRRRGILPESIWELIIQVGIKPSSAKISLENLYATNRKYLEPRANRYMFVPNPVKLRLKTGLKELVAKIPRHPSYPERGIREIKLKVCNGIGEVYVPGNEVENITPGKEIRLLGLANIRLLSDEEAEVLALGVEYAKSKSLPIIQWCPVMGALNATIIVAKGNKVAVVEGVVEPGVKEVEVGMHAQFYRFGFTILENKEKLTFIYTHD